MNTRQIQELFKQTLRGRHESGNAWAAVNALRGSGSREVFKRAAEWCRSDNPLKRDRGAAILCQLRKAPAADVPSWKAKPMHRRESYRIIARMLKSERDPIVLDSAISALGHLYNPASVPLILRFLDHPDKDVRFAVAFALGHFPNRAQSVTGLMSLTRDPVAEVRDWAVFGLGVLGDRDSPEIREVLLRRLKDRSVNVREEAAVGLAKRRDQRVIPTLSKMLKARGLKVRVAEASAAILGLKKDPKDWFAKEYRSALRKKFDLPD